MFGHLSLILLTATLPIQPVEHAQLIPRISTVSVCTYAPHSDISLLADGRVEVVSVGYRPVSVVNGAFVRNVISVDDATTGQRLLTYRFGCAVYILNIAPVLPSGHTARVHVEDWAGTAGDITRYLTRP